MKFTAAGDCLCQRRIPEDYEGFEKIRDFILKGDARFFNLETTVNYEGECYACQHSGGTYVRCEPEVVADVLEYGFNMTSFNNNHTMDFDRNGVELTKEYVDALDIVNAGVGLNLHQASAPMYLETKNGRVALIGVNALDNNALMAGEQSRRFPGRPGVNGIRLTTKIVVPQKAFDVVKEIGEKTLINGPRNVHRGEGYFPWPEEGTAELDEAATFVLGDDYGLITEANKADMKRITDAIEEANLQADYVIVSIHGHLLVGNDKYNVPEVQEQICRAFVDAGADAVIGHGPHLLRAIEVYKGKPIFYSLGDFLVQLYQVPAAPEDFYRKYNMDSNSSVISLLAKRSQNFTIGLMEDPKMRESVIPYWETDENKNITKLTLMPITCALGKGKHLEGLPQPSEDLKFMEKLAELCKPYGVNVKMEDGVAVCTW